MGRNWKIDDDAVESASINVRTLETDSFEFVVKNYSRYKESGVTSFESQCFSVGGYQWAVHFYPEGISEAALRHGEASAYIVLLSECSAPVQTMYELYLLDQSGGGNHRGGSLFHPNKMVFFNRGRCMHGPKGFINRASLEPPSVYLKDDCLKISCTIGVFVNRIQALSVIEVASEPTVWEDFGRLLETKRGADVFFRVDDETFSAHKFILVACSRIFRQLFSDHAHQQDQEIRIPNMEARIFKAMLGFIYTGTLVEEDQESFGDSYAFVFDSFLGKMIAAADQFELKRLKKLCESRILKRLSKESVAHLRRLADLYHATELKAACPRFAAENKAGGSCPCRLLLEMVHDNKDSGEKPSTKKFVTTSKYLGDDKDSGEKPSTKKFVTTSKYLGDNKDSGEEPSTKKFVTTSKSLGDNKDSGEKPYTKKFVTTSKYLGESTCPLSLEMDHGNKEFGENLCTKKEMNFFGKIASVIKRMIRPLKEKKIKNS